MAQAPEPSPFHRALILSNALQKLSPSIVAVSFGFNSVLVAAIWLFRNDFLAALIATMSVLIASLGNWALLRRLPEQKRSFGPDQPSALALSMVTALTVALIGLFGVSIVVALVAVAAISALAYYATWIEPFALSVTRQSVTAPAWQGEGVCLRLLHLADLHMERISPREEQLNHLIASLKPDVIVFSGDFVNLSYTDDPQAKNDIRLLLSAWRAPLGVYCVPGTPAVESLARVREFVAGLDNLTLLTNDWVTVGTACGALHILGMITTHDLPTDREALAHMMESAPAGGAKLLLTHSPDIAPEAAAAGFDLYVCGHTHGGQIRLPLIGALATASHWGRRFVMGRYQVKQMSLYTSRGIGMEGLGAPRARLLCPPEVILWEMIAAQ